MPDNHRRWRDKFRQECNYKIKNARQEKVDAFRENKLMQYTLSQQWDNFKKENEQEMMREGIVDMDELIEESLMEEYEKYQKQEQEELEDTIASYERASLICVHCHKDTLIYTSQNMLSCPTCGFYATEICLQSILNAINQHSNQCQGRIEFSLEPGATSTILANCDICDLWDMFYM